MALSSPGVGSGLDVNSIVTQLMTVERLPVTLLAKKEAGYQSKLSAYGSLKSALGSFQSAMSGLNNAARFQSLSATAADPTVLPGPSQLAPNALHRYPAVARNCA